MSNKLVKNEEQKERITEKQKKYVFWGSLLILSIAFVFVWGKVFVTTKAFNEQMEGMVLGEDYYLEDIVITDKRVETGTSDDTISENYFFYIKTEKPGSIINGCRYRGKYIRSMLWEIP